MQGIIFDIQRFAVHDGPGIRTTVFLKGCPLRCLWCHNPEAFSKQPQLVYHSSSCIGCQECLHVCQHGGHRFMDDRHEIVWEQCVACGACVAACYTGALQLAGRTMTVDEVMAEVLRDRPFYQASGGGITLSGGEPLVQLSLTHSLLQAAKAEGLHTALDTSGCAPWDHLSSVLPHTDLVLYDLKQMDPDRHRALTGIPNHRILDNLRRLDAAGHAVWIRIPLIPGQNDDEANFHALGEFLATLTHVERIEILRYHRLAESKYERIGRDYALRGLLPPTLEQAEARRHILLGYGLEQVAVR